MNAPSFRTLLESGHSKEITLRIISHIKSSPERMEELMDCFFDENLRICQRASWPVGLIVDHKPHLLQPYLEKMLRNLENPKHDAVVRNTFRTLQNMDIPEELEGMAFESALNYLLNPQNAIAIRVFAMTVCGNIALKYPELKDELVPVIREHLPHGSAGFVNRGKKIIKQLTNNRL